MSSAEKFTLSSNPTALLFYGVLRGDTAQVEAALTAGASAREPQIKYWDIAEKLADEENVKMFASFFSPEMARLTHAPLIAPLRPPLYFAVKRGHYDAALVLLDRGADPNWTAPPRNEAIGDSFALLPLAVRGGDVRLVSALLRVGADVNHATLKGMTALRVAVKMGNTEIVRLLLRAGADARFVSPKGVTLLMEAAGHGVAGFDLDSLLPGEEIGGSFSLRRTMKMQGSHQTPTGDLPVTKADDASPDDYAEIARLLLEHGANLHAVVPLGDKEMDALGGTTALQAAANVHDTNMVRLLLDAGADPNVGGGLFGTPLMAAIGSDIETSNIVHLLHERGANVNQADASGVTPLMKAAMTGQADLIPALLGWGADLHARRPMDALGESGFDALMHAARSGRADCAARLLDAGATLDARTPKGSDALMIAAFSRHAGVVRLLLERGADPTRQNNEGKTARDLAQMPTPASRMAGKMTEKYGATPDQMVQKVKEEIEAEVMQDAHSPQVKQAMEDALPEPMAIMTNLFQTMQNTTNEKLRREAESQAEILALLPAPSAE